MIIHEYQTKKIFSSVGIPVLKGKVAYTPNEALTIAQNIGGESWYVKAQVLSSGRALGKFLEEEAGSGSGLQVADGVSAVPEIAGKMLLHHLLTQNEINEVKKVYIEEKIDIVQAFDFEICVDFVRERVLFKGKDLKKKKKEVCYELSLDKKLSLMKSLALVAKVGVPKGFMREASATLRAMFDLFKKYNAFSVEVKPLVITSDKRLVALDGKIYFDPDAVSKHKEIQVLRDFEMETANQKKARDNNFRYIPMDGNIGCIINGSGLSMGTLDLIVRKGGRPSCLLDLGGTPTKEMVSDAVKIILSEPDTEGLLVNIFGANARCDIIADGLVAAAKEISSGMPIVVRMDGTNASVGERLLFESGLPFIVKQKMTDAVSSIVEEVEAIR